MTPKLDNRQGIAVFTDGSAYTKDRSGGWGWVAVDAYGNEYENSGHVEDTTISQMELCAAAMGLFSVASMCGPSDVLVFSDSQYVVLGMNDKSRARRKNTDWWYELECAVWEHETHGNVVAFEHVKGHAGSTYNERADKLAGKARKTGASTRTNN